MQRDIYHHMSALSCNSDEQFKFTQIYVFDSTQQQIDMCLDYSSDVNSETLQTLQKLIYTVNSYATELKDCVHQLQECTENDLATAYLRL